MSVVPLILAAGASTRMGRCKPLLDFDGRSCLEVVMEVSRRAKLAAPVVVLGHEADAVKARVPLTGMTVVVNADFAKGQTSSVKAGLRSLPPGATAFLLHPVDFPLIRPDDIADLVAAWSRPGSPARILIPSFNLRRGHPVLFAAALKDEILALGDDEPVRAVVNRDPGRIGHVEARDARVLVDMDTPEDYARCLEAYRRPGR